MTNKKRDNKGPKVIPNTLDASFAAMTEDEKQRTIAAIKELLGDNYQPSKDTPEGELDTLAAHQAIASTYGNPSAMVRHKYGHFALALQEKMGEALPSAFKLVPDRGHGGTPDPFAGRYLATPPPLAAAPVVAPPDDPNRDPAWFEPPGMYLTVRRAHIEPHAMTPMFIPQLVPPLQDGADADFRQPIAALLQQICATIPSLSRTPTITQQYDYENPLEAASMKHVSGSKVLRVEFPIHAPNDHHSPRSQIGSDDSAMDSNAFKLQQIFKQASYQMGAPSITVQARGTSIVFEVPNMAASLHKLANILQLFHNDELTHHEASASPTITHKVSLKDEVSISTKPAFTVNTPSVTFGPINEPQKREIGAD